MVSNFFIINFSSVVSKGTFCVWNSLPKKIYNYFQFSAFKMDFDEDILSICESTVS